MVGVTALSGTILCGVNGLSALDHKRDLEVEPDSITADELVSQDPGIAGSSA